MTEQEQNKTDDSTKSGSASTAPTPPITNSTLKTTNADVGVVVRRRRRRVVAVEEGPAVDPILLQKVLTESSLPSAYTFEVTKSVQRILKLQATHVALQMPEGLLLYATVLADQVSILGDVTYGACCVDDLGAQALGAELLIHYGHSCLVPLQHTVVPCLYVFVEIHVDVPHLVDCLDITLRPQSPKPRVYLLGTVQFRHAFVQATQLLKEKGYEEVSIPQAKPLSPGEVLGCTSPELVNDGVRSIVCFVADGRFHLEATLISNPHVDLFYRYDPYSKTLTEEAYDHDQMKSIRSSAIATSRGAQVYGIVLGTLGRQGNPAIVHRIRESLRAHGKRHFLMLLSEITPAKLQLFDGKIDAWVQVACPRLSVDWGHFLSKKPVLSPYELFVSLEETDWRDNYPMDYYAHAGGPWTNYFEENKQRQLP